MKKLSCECCGAALPIPDRYQRYVKCAYCGATYEVEHWEVRPDKNCISIPDVHYILVEPGHIQKLSAQVCLDEYQVRAYPPELIEREVRHRLAEEIMEYLEKELKIYEDIDIFKMGRKYSTMIYLDTRGFK